jgi:starch synthase
VARELVELLGNPERARELGAAGQKRARKEFSVAAMADRTLDVYRESV